MLVLEVHCVFFKLMRNDKTLENRAWGSSCLVNSNWLTKSPASSSGLSGISSSARRVGLITRPVAQPGWP